MNWPVHTINLGTSKPFRRDGSTSAIVKTPTDRPVAIGPLGLAGDEQAALACLADQSLLAETWRKRAAKLLDAQS